MAIHSSLDHGQDTVTTAGSAEPLNGGTSLTLPNGAELAVRANSGNGGDVFVGDSNVESTNGFILGAGESVSLAIEDVSSVYIDVETNGEGVSWIVENDG